jgi:hypothetical protein
LLKASKVMQFSHAKRGLSRYNTRPLGAHRSVMRAK